MQKYNTIPNLIFDFGGVLLNINPQRAVDSFKKIGLTDTELVKKEYQHNGLFDLLEKGFLTPAQFRSELRKYISRTVTDQEIDEAWNSMLLDLPWERLNLLSHLRKNHRVFLLSNTNAIHWEAYTSKIKNVHGVQLSSFFEKDYYSHQMGLRKPDTKIYTTVLEMEGLKASETLFIDDVLVNVKAAQSVGMKIHHLNLEKGESILDLFKN
ncbi:HAD family hydrolase [Ancylomarina longa]|uniref:HAD family phosphatase n=1 Tax=Ancylomarina longa TaxID=2487017 RepID=A0A434ATM1_9BACT|nr:HAD family phosphatase [Ancylomarina longa]RUT77750.1 HAD family phosphatase [Ancylomarina longa]